NAEKVLAAVADDSSVAPDTQRAALLELGRLYHKSGDFKSAVSRLEQFAARFPKDERLGEVMFLTADCRWQLAAQIDVRLASASASSDAETAAATAMTTAAATKKEHLQRAAELFARVAELYR